MGGERLTSNPKRLPELATISTKIHDILRGAWWNILWAVPMSLEVKDSNNSTTGPYAYIIDEGQGIGASTGAGPRARAISQQLCTIG